MDADYLKYLCIPELLKHTIAGMGAWCWLQPEPDLRVAAEPHSSSFPGAALGCDGDVWVWLSASTSEIRMRCSPCNQTPLEPAWGVTLEGGKPCVLPTAACLCCAEPAAGVPATHTPASTRGYSQGGTATDRSGEDVRHLKVAITQPAGLMGMHLKYKAQRPLLWVKL